MLARQIAPAPGERILDVGCGTGSLAILLKKRCPEAILVGIDPDPEILKIARAKAEAAGVAIDFEQGFARDVAGRFADAAFDKVVSSLVFHQVPMAEKRAGLDSMRAAVRDGGQIHIADYGVQSWLLERALFKVVQRLDGVENTQPNADGAMDALIGDAGLRTVSRKRVLTPTGAITLWAALRISGVVTRQATPAG